VANEVFWGRQKRWGDPAPKPRVNMPKESDLPPLRCPILPLFRGCSPPSGTERVRPPKDTSLLGRHNGRHACRGLSRPLTNITSGKVVSPRGAAFAPPDSGGPRDCPPFGQSSQSQQTPWACADGDSRFVLTACCAGPGPPTGRQGPAPGRFPQACLKPLMCASISRRQIESVRRLSAAPALLSLPRQGAVQISSCGDHLWGRWSGRTLFGHGQCRT
jgi:hypothetical protein